jgi:hypothetical protein
VGGGIASSSVFFLLFDRGASQCWLKKTTGESGEARSCEADEDDDDAEPAEVYDPTDRSSLVKLQALMMVCEVGASQRICIAFLCLYEEGG